MNNTCIKILLVEDNYDDIALISAYLNRSKMEHELTIVNQKNEFMEMINTAKFDFVVCDHSLPRFNSPEAYKLAYNLAPDIPFIAISGIAAEEDLIQIFVKGADNYVMKDNLKRLPSAIQRAMEIKKGKFKASS